MPRPPRVSAARRSGALPAIERLTGVTPSGLAVAGFAVLGWVAARAFGGRALYLLAYIAVFAVGGSVYLARRRRPLVAERSDVVRRGRVGQTLNVDVSLTARRRTSTFVLEERIPPGLGTPVRLNVPSVGPGDEITHSYQVKPTVRGVYEIGPLCAEFTDPFGLSRWQQPLLPATEVIVHPNVEEVLDRPLTRAFEDPPLRPPTSRAWPEGFEFYGMRDYVRGDDVRRIVWRAFGRTRKLLVREFEQGIDSRITVVLDTDSEWHSHERPSETFETAVRVAASVGVRHIKDGFTVRLEANDGTLGPNAYRGPHARLDYLDQLARVTLSRTPLSKAMDRLVRGDRRDSHVVLVTARLDPASVAAANLLIQGGASFTVCAITWPEGDPLVVARAHEIGAQVVQVRPGSPLSGVFRASLQTNVRSHA